MTYQISQLYLEFCSCANVWAGDISSFPVKRKSTEASSKASSRNDYDDTMALTPLDSDHQSSSELQMRCRFFQALMDVEKTGLARIKRDLGGKNLVFDRQIVVWT